MDMIVPTGMAMVLTSVMLTTYGWVSECQTCLSAGDGGIGSGLIVAGLGTVAVGSWLGRRRR